MGTGTVHELAAFVANSKTPVALDESVPDARAVAGACESRLAPIIVVKAGHLGTAGAAAAISLIAAAGLSSRIGGLVETTIGRNHALALATLRSASEAGASPAGASPAGDLAAGSPYFVAEPASLPLVLDEGDAVAASSPGIGVELDMDVVQRFTVTRATFR
jgi:O-succinylbenzoate synthase